MEEQPRPQAQALLRRFRSGGRLSIWLLGIRDLQWRRRRFGLTVAAASLPLALALLLSGVSAALDNEADRTVASFHADAWLVRAGSTGPFSSPAPFPAAWLGRVRGLAGVRSAAAVVIGQATKGGSRPRQVNINGVTPGGVGAPAGRLLRELAPGSVLVDASLDVQPGDELDLNGIRVRVGGLLHGRTYFAGVPIVVVGLREAQRITFGGLPRTVPGGLVLLTSGQVADDLRRPVARAGRTISLIRILLWIVAAAIIGAFVYLSALERRRELAVLKAIGIPSPALAGGLAVQAVAAGLVASLLGIGVETIIAPISDLSVEVPELSYLLLPLIAAGISLLACLVALRKALSLDPALAFGNA